MIYKLLSIKVLKLDNIKNVKSKRYKTINDKL